MSRGVEPPFPPPLPDFLSAAYASQSTYLHIYVECDRIATSAPMEWVNQPARAGGRVSTCQPIRRAGERRGCWLLMMWGDDVIFLGGSPRGEGEVGEGGLYSLRHLPCIIKVGAKTTTKNICSTLYTLFLYAYPPPPMYPTSSKKACTVRYLQ